MPSINHIFNEARSHKTYSATPVERSQLEELYRLTRMSPTANNSCPLRIVFITSKQGMVSLAEAALGFNKEKTESASAAAILGYDINYFEHFSLLAPHMSQPSAHSDWPIEKRERFALQNANIQAGFFIVAARSLGLDCGPMAGFDAKQIESRFFDHPNWRYNFVVLLGKAELDSLKPRASRLDIETACRFC